MNSHRAVPLVAALLCLASGLPTQAAESGKELAQKAQVVLKEYCYQCHGIKFEAEGLDVLNLKTLLAKRGDDKPPYVIPGKPDESPLYRRVHRNTMPPKKETKRPSAEDKLILKQWIEAGAPAFPATVSRSFKSTQEVLTDIYNHLRQTPAEDRPYQRFFTLTHRYNNTNISEEDLALERAALAKLVNSLSWRPDIVVPKAIDQQQTIFQVDLHDLDWDERRLWNEILKVYPYALKYANDEDARVRNVAEQVYELAGTDMPALRSDWFIATASRPPLYDVILNLPKNAVVLEKKLGVRFQENFLRNKLARAGFTTSAVSGQNRLVERHAASYGAYWKSYDFKPNKENGILARYPLGPEFHGNPFPRQAFEHDGGEIIFNLPNGLQAYLLVNGKDQRIDVGPIEVVSDSLKTAGTAAIVTGLSCMACHKHGMIRFKDNIRFGQALAGHARQKVEQLYPLENDMKRLLKKDEDRFVQALERAMGEFVKGGAGKDGDIRDVAEPIGEVARLYLKDLGPTEVALELGLADAKELKVAIHNNHRLRELGLGPLAQGDAIKRELWESLERVTSVFHETAREMQLGTPVRVLGKLRDQ